MGAFAISKFIELGDTAFLAARNRPIKFIHYYHHASVLLITWYLFVTRASIGPIFVAMNYLVHVMLYSYYLASATTGVFRYMAKSCAQVVTFSQVAQMIFGILVSTDALARKLNGQECSVDYFGLCAALASYVVYFVLFARLWIDLYGFPFGHEKAA